MLPLQLGVLISGLIGVVFFNIFLRGVTNTASSYSSSSYSSGNSTALLFESFGEGMAILVSITLLSIVFVSGFITLVLVARNIYKNFYSSEGYLTFTLPVSVDQHLQAKTISGLVWLLINMCIIVLTVVLLIVFGTATEGLISVEVMDSIGQAFHEFFTPMGILFLIEVILVTVLSSIMSITQIIFSVTLGGAAARTHKVLAGIGIYLASGAIVSTLMSIFLFIAQMMFYSVGESYSAYATYTSGLVEAQPTMIITALCCLAFSLIFYFISRNSLKNSLNLE